MNAARPSRWQDSRFAGATTKERTMEELIGLPVLQPGIRSSSVRSSEECPRKFMWAYKYGLRRRGSYRSAFGIGNVYHEIKTCQYKGLTRSEATTAVNVYVEKKKQEIKDAKHSRTGLLPGGRDVDGVLREIDRDRAIGMAMGFWSWENDPLDAQKYTPLTVEQTLKLKIPQVRHQLSIKCDLVLIETPKKDELAQKKPVRIWIHDHKTTSIDPLARSQSVSYSLQLELYRAVLQSWLRQQADPELNSAQVVGSVHTIIRKPTIIQRTKRNPESFDEYLERIRQWYPEKHAAGENVFVHAIKRFSGPVDDPEMLYRLRRTANLSKSRVSFDKFYRVDHQCIVGHVKCAFLPLCEASPFMWQHKIQTMYEQDPEINYVLPDNYDRDEE